LDVEPDKVFCQNSPRVVLSDDVIEEAERAAVSRGEAYPEPWRDICRSELLGEIEAAIISLDDESQEVIRAIYIDGETIKRAGERIGRPTTTTDDIRERALRRMSKMPQIVEIRRWG
jgi:DNA-directed RNA polymerase specialized sigma24 family protein